MTRTFIPGSAIILMAFGLTVTILATVIMLVLSRQDVANVRQALISSCERGNLIRERQNRVIRELRIPLQPLPLIDCKKVVG